MTKGYMVACIGVFGCLVGASMYESHGMGIVISVIVIAAGIIVGLTGLLMAWMNDEDEGE